MQKRNKLKFHFRAQNFTFYEHTLKERNLALLTGLVNISATFSTVGI